MQERRSQQARSQAARDQIVQAALTVFALKGFAASSMDDLCLAAGCSKGGLYHHFPTKHAVLAGVVERLSGAQALVPPFDGASSTALPPAALGRVMLEVWTEAARDDDIRARLRTGLEAQLESSLDGGTIAQILRIGGLIEFLTRTDSIRAEELERKLGAA